MGMRVQGTGAEFFDFVHRKKLLPFVGIDEFDVLNFVGGAEAVEEMANREGRFDRDEVGDGSQIGDFLNGVGADHRDAGLTDGIDVLVITEDRQSAGG